MCNVTYLLTWLEFTGVSAPYEAPENPEIHIDGAKSSVEDSVKAIMDYLLSKKYIWVKFIVIRSSICPATICEGVMVLLQGNIKEMVSYIAVL